MFGCTAESCSYRDPIEEFERVDTTVYGVSTPTSPQQHECWWLFLRLDHLGPAATPEGALSTATQDLVDDESVDNAYDLVLRDLQGELVRLRDLRGHPVILSFLRYIG